MVLVSSSLQVGPGSGYGGYGCVFHGRRPVKSLSFAVSLGCRCFKFCKERPEGFGDAWCSLAMFRVLRRWACAACVMSYPGLRWLCGCGSTL